MSFEKNSYSRQNDKNANISEDLSSQTLLDKIATICTQLFFHEYRALIISSLLGSFFLIIGIGIYISKKNESSSLISYETSQILNQVEESNYTFIERTKNNHSDAYQFKPKTLLENIKTLYSFAKKTEASLEKSSGVLANGILSLENEASLEKKIQQYRPNCIQISCNYFQKIKMPAWRDFLVEMEIFQKQQELQPNNPKSATPTSRKDELLQLYKILTSSSSTRSEKEAQARMFFEKYPDFAILLEKAWDQKISNFYQTIGKSNQY